MCLSDNLAERTHGYIIIRYRHTHTPGFSLLLPHTVTVWTMNSHSTINQTPEQNMWVIVCISMRILRLRTRSSPMFGCFSKRQILASLSNFWWSKRRTEEKQTWRQGETGYLQCSWLSFAMIGFLNHPTWSWLQVSFDLVEGTAQVFGHRCQHQCGVFVIDIRTSVYLLALCQPGLFPYQNWNAWQK